MAPVIAIVGPTSSGKSALAMKVAKEYDGEIIAADSRTVYKDMDIGTAKPSQEERKEVPHHGLDLITPDKAFSAAEFKRYAQNAIKEIRGRNHLPIVVGGTGLYVDGLIYDFDFDTKPDPKLRAKLESLNLNELQKMAEEKGISQDQVNFANPRHLSRAIERRILAGTKQKQSRPGAKDYEKPNRNQLKPRNVLTVGLNPDKEKLKERIAKRVDKMFAEGLVEEVQNVIEKYGPGAPGLLAPGYKAVKEYINGAINLQEAKELFISNDKNLAKRQMTWFKRNPDIVWCDDERQAINNIRAFLSEFDTIHS